MSVEKSQSARSREREREQVSNTFDGKQYSTYY